MQRRSTKRRRRTPAAAFSSARLWGAVGGFWLLLAAPLGAQSAGFHYVPLLPATDPLFERKHQRQAAFNTVAALLSESTYGGSGESTWMPGVGAHVVESFRLTRYVTLLPQYGLNLFFGRPPDYSGEPRARVSMQVPLQLHYAFQIYRDDRGVHVGPVFAAHTALLTPLTLDLTTDGFSSSGDVGAQLALSYTWPWRTQAVQVAAGVARFFFGYYYVDDDVRQEWTDVDGEPLDLSLAVHWLVFPWRASVAFEYHFTSSLGDLQGDTVQLLAAHVVFRSAVRQSAAAK